MARTRAAAAAAPATRRSARAAAPAAAAADPGFITVRVGKLPGHLQTIALNDGRKVKDALEGANLDPRGYEIKVGTAAATLETDLGQDDTVLLVKKIRNNS